MKKFLIIGFFCLLSTLAQAQIQLRITPSQLNVEDPFRLTLTLNGSQQGGIPDLTPLQKNFLILSTERRMNYSVINGQIHSLSEWSITLKAQKSGKLTIPAIKIGTEQTTPLTLDIAGSTKSQYKDPVDTSAPQKSLYLTTEINKKNPYINQQITYKVTLYNSKQILDANYQAPQVENALIIPLGGEKRYQREINNETYVVEEQNYAIFPQKSGPLRIKSPIFTALIYDFNPKRVKAQDKTINIKVAPIPKEYSGKKWLPAQKVRLFERYEHSEHTLTQGTTLTRTVILEGVGLPAQLLPKLHFAQANGFNVYPEKGKDKNRITQGELIGRTEFKITYLFNKADKVTIPELKLPWFNTETGKEELATLPEKTIEITPSSMPDIKQPTSSLKTPSLQPLSPNEGYFVSTTYWPWMLALFFALVWLITLILWKGEKYRRSTKKGHYKTVLRELHHACRKANPEQTGSALLKWAKVHWNDESLLNLTDLTRLTQDEGFIKQIHLLTQVLYKNQERTPWRGEELWQSIRRIKKTKQYIKETINNLPPINP